MESETVKTFHSVLELVMEEPNAIIDDSSFDKIVDSLYELCRADTKYLDSVFQSVAHTEKILEQLALNVNSKAAAFGIRLLEIYIVFQKVQYQHYTSLLKQLLTANSQPNVVCVVLSVLKAVLNSCDGICWLLEEQIHLLVINQLTTSSFFVARMTEDVIQCIILSCTTNVIDKCFSSHELCKRCLDDLIPYLGIDSQSSVAPFTTLIRLVSHLFTSGLSAESLQYLLTNYWPFDKWFTQFTIRTAEECQLILNLFETCIKSNWTTLLRPFLSDDSIIFGHASSLCGRGMVPVAISLLALTVSLPLLNGIKTNESFLQLLFYPMSFLLQKDDVSCRTDDHKVIVMSMSQFVLEHTEQALLSVLKNIKYIMKTLGGDWWAHCLELCVDLLGTCANHSSDAAQYKLSMSSQHKVITELLVLFSEVLEGDYQNCLKIKLTPLTQQLAKYLTVVVQKRSLPIQVICKSLYLIGQVLTTLLQQDMGVPADLATSGHGLLSSIAESLELCSMDINWEIRDSCVELIGCLAHEQISDGMMQFLSSSKLCDLLVTRGLVDIEPCVKASAILSLSSVMTTPLLAKLFMQQRSDHFSDHVSAAHALLEFTHVSSHETMVRLTAWRAFNVVCKRNSELMGLLTDGNNSLQTLSTHLLQGITDDNWEIKVEVMEILTMMYQFLVTKQASIPDYIMCCNNQVNNEHDSKCHVLNTIGFFPVLKEAITDYHGTVRKKGEHLVNMLESTPHNCDCHHCKKCLLEVSELCHSNCTVQERSPQEIFLDVLQEILMAAKCEQSELREADCY